MKKLILCAAIFSLNAMELETPVDDHIDTSERQSSGQQPPREYTANITGSPIFIQQRMQDGSFKGRLWDKAQDHAVDLILTLGTSAIIGLVKITYEKLTESQIDKTEKLAHEINDLTDKGLNKDTVLQKLRIAEMRWKKQLILAQSEQNEDLIKAVELELSRVRLNREKLVESILAELVKKSENKEAAQDAHQDVDLEMAFSELNSVPAAN